MALPIGLKKILDLERNLSPWDDARMDRLTR